MRGEFEPSAEFPGTSRFQVCRRIGHGGMGVVYEALDRERNEEIALKLLNRVDAHALYRFKQEFRVLAECHHPNLVALHELIKEDSHWFFTMELVDGKHFLDHVRDGDEANFAGERGPALLRRLRRTLRQLGEGLTALHDANVLHRDLKPSNVLVTRDGRVVLLDFGVATELGSDGVHDSWMKEIVGTIAYMSPEQAAGLPQSVASDWYSVGVMLYEALTGRLPHASSTPSVHGRTEKLNGSGSASASWLDLVMAKQSDDPPAPSALAAGIPGDLNELCVALLSRRPEVRPTGADVLRIVAGGSRRSSLKLQYAVTARPKTTFIGRDKYLAQLRGALDETISGRPAVVFVHGASGIGKTALVHQFLGEVDTRIDAVVLDGRCFEREFLPYKGVDSLVDALCRYLSGLSIVEVTALLPRDVAELARVFPVLSGIEAISRVPRRTAAGADPQELRRRAFAALRELLARIADRRCLVLHVDDLQWGDTDGAARLAELVSPPDAPNALLVLSYRSHDTAARPPVELLRTRLAAIRYGAPALHDLEVVALADHEAHELASSLLGDISDADTIASAIVRESGGNPFFVEELARHLLQSDGARPRVAALQDVVASRLSRVPEESRRALEVIAVAGQPVDQIVAARAAGADDIHILDALRHAHLVQSAGDDTVVIGHDRIREAVLAQLGEAQLAKHHVDIARALESTGRTDAERLAVHYRAAGEIERAARYALVAASHAMEALAFDRAAQLYTLTLETLPLAAEGRQSLLSLLGDALSNAGRGPEAARAYAEAAELALGTDALELQRRAAEQLLRSGHIDEGLVALERVLASAGMRLAQTPRRALWSLLIGRMRVRLRGLGYKERSTEEIDPLQRARIDTCWSVTIGLGLVDPIRATAFQLRHLLLSLQYGDTHRVSRAIAAEVAYRATAGASAHRQTARLLRAAEAIAERTGGPYELAFATLSSGMAAYFEGRWPRAYELNARAESMFREQCPGIIWELNSARIFSLWALCYRGDLGELARLIPTYVQDAQSRGDLYMKTSIETGLPNLIWLARDDPDAARAQVAEGMRGWSQDGFHAQHYWKLLALSHADLYAGDPRGAWSRVVGNWSKLRWSMLTRVEVVRIEALYLRGRAAVATAVFSSRSERNNLLRSAARDSRRLAAQRAAWAEPIAWLLRGSIAAVQGDTEAACDALATAEHSCDEVAMQLHAAAARRRRGELMGGSEGQELIARADDWMTEHGVRNPERMTRLMVPG